jgi:hypothetical protein
MNNYKRKEVMDYLTRKPLSEQDLQLAYEAGQQTLDSIPETPVASNEERVLNTQPFYQQPQQLIQDDIARPQVDDIPLYQGVQPNVAIKETMPTYVPPDMAPVMPQAPGVPDPQYRQIELATGGRANFNEGSKLTGTDKTLEQNIKDDHKAYNDYRKSIGSPTIPLDNEYIRMWIRSRLNSGGPANKQPQKIIPLDLESVAFKLFQDKLDNLSYNQKQTVYDYIEDNRNKKATGGRVKFQNGSDDGYMQEIPSLGFSDPIDILEQQLINEKDSTRVNALSHLLENAKKERKAKEIAKEEFKKSQKEKGIRYKEDFPSEAAYFAETGKQLLTNPKYTLGSFGKGAVQGTEWLVGQPLKILFDQEGKNFEFYEPVLTKKLGIDKFVEENIPKGATTGTLFGGETIKTIGEFADPFLAYGLAKGAIKGAKPKPPTTAVDETIDPTRRDILKTGAVMGTGAVLYPTAKKLGMFDELAKTAKVARVLPAAKGMPEWFSPLVSRIQNEGLDITSQAKKAQKLEYEKRPISNAKDFEIVQSRKIELPTTGKNPEIITMTEYKNGTIHIESNTSGGAFDSPYDLYYSPPKEVTEIQNIRDKDGNLRKTEVKVKKDGEFTVLEQRPFFNPKYEGDNALELEYIERNFDDSISDVEKLEEFATGKKVDPKKNEKRKEYKKYAEENPSDDAASRAPDEDRSYYDW